MKIAVIQASSQKEKNTLQALFSGPFGCGYPKKDAGRKQADAKTMKELNRITKRTLADILPEVDRAFLASVFSRRSVYDYVLEYGKDKELHAMLREFLD